MNPDGESSQRVFHTLKDDLFRDDFLKSMRRDFREAREFMIDEQRKKRLATMSRPKGFLFTVGWMVKSMFLKLTPARRLLLALGLVFLVLSRTEVYAGSELHVQTDFSLPGIACVLFVLILELKDKLIAKDELREGHAVQQALMPTGSPEVAGWDIWLFTRPANDVGGDLVDCITVSEHRRSIVLADVAGKGLGAALLMAKLQASVRALVGDTPSPVALGMKLNTIFCRDSLRNIFASLVYVDLKPDSGDIALLNAGHLPPVVVRGHQSETLPKGGIALGLILSAEFTEHRVTLHAGDYLCIYSDGITEAQDVHGNFFGEQRFITSLLRNTNGGAEQAGRGLLAEVDSFVGDAPRFDDLSLVLLRRL
jgi:phosphoserine phosphatase RsbU/P